MVKMEWLWHAILARVVWEIITICGLGTALAIVRKRLPDAFPWIQAFVVGSACGAILLFAFTGRGILAPRPTSIDNIQETVEKWLIQDGVTMLKRQDPGDVFRYDVTGEDGFPMTVYQPNGTTILEIRSDQRWAPATAQEIKAMTVDERKNIELPVIIELSKMHVTFIVDPDTINVRYFVQTRINESLTEQVFLDKFQDVNSAVVLAHNLIASGFSQVYWNKHHQPPPALQ
jgi:hypothetical protein